MFIVTRCLYFWFIFQHDVAEIVTLLKAICPLLLLSFHPFLFLPLLIQFSCHTVPPSLRYRCLLFDLFQSPLSSSIINASPPSSSPRPHHRQGLVQGGQHQSSNTRKLEQYGFVLYRVSVSVLPAPHPSCLCLALCFWHCVFQDLYYYSNGEDSDDGAVAWALPTPESLDGVIVPLEALVSEVTDATKESTAEVSTTPRPSPSAVEDGVIAAVVAATPRPSPSAVEVPDATKESTTEVSTTSRPATPPPSSPSAVDTPGP